MAVIFAESTAPSPGPVGCSEIWYPSVTIEWLIFAYLQCHDQRMNVSCRAVNLSLLEIVMRYLVN